ISGDVDVTSNGKGSVVQLPRLTAFDSIVKTNGGQVKKIAPKKSPVEDNKTIEGTAKDDLINGTKKDDIINGQAGDDTLNGNNGNDKLLGGKGWDFIQGNEGNDTLLGNENSDVLVGGNGRDILTGGSASDVFFLTPETSKKTLADRITDFDKATDFIVLGNNLTADQVKLEKIKEGTLITVKKTGKILGIVEKVQPSDLEYSLISGNVPSDLGKLVTFGEPISKSLANGNVKLELKGSDGGKFTTTLSEEKGIEQIRYLAGRSSNIKGSFTLDIKNNGSQINLQIDGNKNEWEIKRKKNEEIDVSLNGEVFMTLPPIPKNDDGGEDTDCCDIDLLDPCKIFKQICATVEQINSVLSWIPPLPSLAPLTAVQMGLEFTEYACLLVLGDDQKLNDLIASKTLSFLSEKAGDAMLNFYRKQTRFNKFLDDNEIFINPKVFDALERTKKQNDDIFKQFLGNGVNSVPFFSDLSSSIVRFIDDKLPNNNRNNVMKNLRKHLGIDWCDEDVETKEANIEIAGPKEVDHHKYALFTVSYDNPEKEAKGVEIMGFDGLTSGVKFVPIPKAKLEEGKFQFKAYNEDFFGSVDAEKVFSANLVSEPSVFSYTIAASDPDATVNFLGAGGWSGLNAQAIPATDKNGDFWVKWL
ncbi:calcium-binding protein, partial [Lyngbya sp. CCY1209]|uniref:calcium-binding protein n=1 Tax=Lyngbya sp. CCY1209 TaxID=2886103 RepID=UPI002D21624B